MRHKYLPRLSAVVLTLGYLAACSDPAGPGRAPRLVLEVDAPAGDSLAQLGVGLVATLRDSVPIRQVRVYVDSAAGSAPQQVIDLTPPDRRAAASAIVSPTGLHVVTVAVTDAAGASASASVTRTFRVPAAGYSAARLPDLGGGATALHLNAAGDVAGYVLTTAGRKRPAVWRDGRLSVLAVPDTVDVVATRVNAAGDVLLQYPRSSQVPGASLATYTSARVLRADGALLGIGPLWIPFPPPTVGAGLSCCTLAGDLNDRREAVASNRPGDPWPVTLRLNVATGAADTTQGDNYPLLNNAGQRAGTRYFSSPSSEVLARGFAVPSRPAGPPARGRCEPPRSNYNDAVDLDDGANLLVRYECVNYAYVSADGSVWLDRYLPAAREQLSPNDGPNIRLSRQGGRVAVLDDGGAVYAWNAATRRTVRAEVTTAPYRLDGLGAVNAAGLVVVHGTDPATGRGAAFLLTPAAP